MIVDVDIGNTRTKWRIASDGVIIDSGVFNTGNQDWSVLEGLQCYRPARVRVSNVAGAVVAAELKQITLQILGVEVEFALACESVAGVSSGYQRPERLGVDRWLAILAAWTLFKHRCVVVDAGSALTLDFLSDEAKHLGGYILPGRQMMVDALLGGTDGVRVDSAVEVSEEYGVNTDQAVQNGCFSAVLALIEKASSTSDKNLGAMGVVLTGGDASALMAVLPGAVVYRPDLVMDGLALALP